MGRKWIIVIHAALRMRRGECNEGARVQKKEKKKKIVIAMNYTTGNFLYKGNYNCEPT